MTARHLKTVEICPALNYNIDTLAVFSCDI